MARWVYRQLELLFNNGDDFRVAHDGKKTFKRPLPFVLDYLNQLGEEGWELTAITPFYVPNTSSLLSSNTYRYFAILKRLEQDTP